MLVSLLPAGRDNARAWTWSDTAAAYQPRDIAVNFKDTIRSASWNREGDSLCVFPMRPDQPARVFGFDGTNYVEKGAFPNAMAGAFSPDDRWLAVVGPGARVQIYDSGTLQPAPETPEMKTSFAPDEVSPEARIFLLRFSEDGKDLGATGMREPARLFEMGTGKTRVIRPASAQDQIVRIDFAVGARGEQRVAAGMNGIVGIWDTSKLDRPLAEPICVAEPMVYPTFSSDGTKLLTLSGPFWTTMNTIRLWETSFRKPGHE